MSALDFIVQLVRWGLRASPAPVVPTEVGRGSVTALEFNGDQSFIYVSEHDEKMVPLRRNCILVGKLVDRDARTLRNENWTRATGLDTSGINVWWEGKRLPVQPGGVHPRVEVEALGWASPVGHPPWTRNQ